MTFERMKEMILNNILVKVLLASLLITILFFYFKAFHTIGVDFDNTFLKKEDISSETHYRGKSDYGDIHITVNGITDISSDVDMIFRLPNNINKEYTVNFKDASNWDLGLENIKDKDGNIIFEGQYRKDSHYLFDKNGKPLVEYNIQFLGISDNLYNSRYRILLKDVVAFAYNENETIRGEYGLLAYAILLFVITFIDIKYPLLFFYLRHSLDVSDPEPSEFYITMQKISWIAFPILGIALMIGAIN